MPYEFITHKEQLELQRQFNSAISSQIEQMGLQNARCPECNAFIGTGGIYTPPHLPGCQWLAEQCMRIKEKP